MILALATAAGVIITALMLIVTIRQNRDTKYLQFIKDTDEELSEMIKEEPKLDSRDSCIIYAYNYIDICDRIMFVIKKGIISKEFFTYYLDFFNYSVTMMWWYTVTYPTDIHSLNSSWNMLTKWIKDENNEFPSKAHPYPIMHLPQKMKELLPTNEQTKDEVKILESLRTHMDKIRTN